MRTRLSLSALVVLGLFGLSACNNSNGASSGGGSTSPKSTSQAALVDTAWDLQSYRGSSGATVPAVSGVSAALGFASHGNLHGSTGCNQFAGTYVASGPSLRINLGPMTLVACTNPALNAQEAAVVRLLAQVAKFTTTAETLSLLDGDGPALLTYGRGLSGLSGTSWRATGVNNGRAAVESTALTEELTAAFGSSDAFSGFGGCNELSGTYQLSGSSGLSISGLTSSQKSCGTEIDQLEQQYTAALGRSSSYDISGDILTLRSAAGEIQVTHRLAG